MAGFRFDVAVRTDIGTREEQQDAVETYAEPNALVAVVCDGMGGMAGGARASRAAAEGLITLVRTRDREESIPNLYLRSVDILDEEIYSFIDEEGERLNAGTTIVSVFISKDQLYWMSVGDSRLYILRGADMVQATRDHNFFLQLESLKDQFTPSDEDLEKGAALISFIGMGGVEVMDISANPIKLECGDTLLLTTDGLFKALTDEEIKTLLSAQATPAEIADRLLAAAAAAAPEIRDNVTFVLIQTQPRTENEKENDNETD